MSTTRRRGRSWSMLSWDRPFLGGPLVHRQQRIKPAGPVEIVEIVEAADMGRANEDLRHGHASVGALNHPAPSLPIAGHVDFGEGHALPAHKRLGRPAIAARAGGVDFDA